MNNVASRGNPSLDQWKVLIHHLSTSHQLSKNTSSTSEYPKKLNCHPSTSYQHSGTNSTADYPKKINCHPSTSYQHSENSNSTSDLPQKLNCQPSTSSQHSTIVSSSEKSTSTSYHLKVQNGHPSTSYQHSPLVKDSEKSTSTSYHLKVQNHYSNTSHQHQDSNTSTTSKSASPGLARAREPNPISTLANSFWSIVTPKERHNLSLQGAPRKPYKPTMRPSTLHCRRNLAKEFADGVKLDATVLPYSPPFSPFSKDDFLILE